MGQALNTTVNGSSGTCVAAADWLRTVADAGHCAAGSVRDARAAAEGGWSGPASQAFRDSVNQVDVVADGMGEWAARVERGLRDFASSLDAVVARMQEALAKAAAGGLEVDGPFIVEPLPVSMPKPGTPVEVCTPGGAHRAIGVYQGDIAQYNAAVAGYNAKAAVYNDCKAIVDAARTTEGNAHVALREALAPPPGGPDIDAYKVGTTTIARVNGYISSFENPRAEALLKAQRAEGSAQFFDNWARGTQISMTAADKELLAWAAEQSRDNKTAYQTRAQQFGQYVEKVPEKLREWIAKYPGKAKYHALPDEAGLGLRTGQKLLKGMPYVGSGLTIATEIVNAATGEQTWGKAAADATGLIVGGSLGAAAAGAAAGAVAGAPLTPVGSFIVGTAGGIAGAIGGQAVVDWLVPE
ncbi:hypothetical protein CU254_41190 (plasmid) [Amycolatopsis sp. AA4]|uniref:hypothetical protein n=1 Tax=Actinomycetes TaxID=1760 RepID=UPI0001B55C31|nr:MULTISPECIES: hypothetical protein [Actinomycetes]ATY17007.1 hypothetical protein CU254_41190 [Amycolatopsis sp. AA4]EFL12504.1 predicted protein [Streptomyces sp. AA4]